jgi:hypothetical protein
LVITSDLLEMPCRLKVAKLLSGSGKVLAEFNGDYKQLFMS